MKKTILKHAQMEDKPTLHLILEELNEMVDIIEENMNEAIDDIFDDRKRFKFANDFIYACEIPRTIGGLSVTRETIEEYYVKNYE